MKIDIPPPPRKLSSFTEMVIESSVPGITYAWLRLDLISVIFIFLLFSGTIAVSEEGGSFLKKSIGVALIIGAGALIFYAGRKLIRRRKQGIRVVKLLKNGATTYGKILENREAEPTIAEAPERWQPVAHFTWEHRIEFQSKAGTVYQTSARLGEQDLIRFRHAAESGILLFYKPENPSDAIVYSTIRNAPDILAGGQFDSVPIDKAHVLVIPALSILFLLIPGLIICIFLIILFFGSI